MLNNYTQELCQRISGRQKKWRGFTVTIPQQLLAIGHQSSAHNQVGRGVHQEIRRWTTVKNCLSCWFVISDHKQGQSGRSQLQFRNRVDFTGQLHQCHIAWNFVHCGKGGRARGTRVSYTRTKPRVNSILAQCKVLVPREKEYWLVILQIPTQIVMSGPQNNWHVPHLLPHSFSLSREHF